MATFPDVPEAITQGEDEEETLMYAVDALESGLSFYVDDRKKLPTPSQPQVDRLFDLRHASKFDQLQKAAAVLGKRFVLNVE